MTFTDFNLSDELKKGVEAAGYTEPTDIQTASIPLILEGRDVIGFSQTGSGKTAAFGLPAINMVDLSESVRKTQIIILCPTRELAMQAHDELLKFSKFVEGLHIVSIYGGQSIEKQLLELKRGCQIIVGTPGRVMDHMRRRTLKLNELKMVVLDEADEMLNMGFREDIEEILSTTPPERQTVLFSATMPKAILDITHEYQRDPELIKIERAALTVDTIEQSYFDIPRGKKKDALSLLLQYYEPKRSIVFCNTKKMVDEMVGDLETRGYKVQGLHGDMRQMQRTQVMERFKNGTFDILVATDVAARGIDVNDVDIVFNYDIPQDPEYYVHRIGRTARAGKTGKSFTLVQGADQFRDLMDIAHYTKSEIFRRELPRVADILDMNTTSVLNDVRKILDKSDAAKAQKSLDVLLSEGFTAEQVAGTLLQMFLKSRKLKVNTVDVKYVNSEKEMKTQKKQPPQRRDRRPNARAAKKFANVDMSKVTISIGRRDKIAPKHILGAVAGESGLPGNIMGSIDIQSNYSTIEVPNEYRAKIVKAVNNSTIKNRKVTAK